MNPFSTLERDALRAQGIVLFANRIIFDAQPPMQEADIAAVQKVCAGPIPQRMLDLWRLSAGGSLDYDLSAEMAGNREALSWTELFYNGSDHYRDLQGWINHELELAEQASEQRGVIWDGKIEALPFGGFEYCDRIYVDVTTGSRNGHILAWKQGLPPAWTHQLHEDGVANIGKDLDSAFAALTLDEDPLDPPSDYYGSGSTFLDYVSRQIADRSLADKVIAFYRKAIVDWRTPMSDGSLRFKPGLAAKALAHAITRDDAPLVKQLVLAGVNLKKPLMGSAGPLETALTCKSYSAAEALLAAGIEVPTDALSNIHSAVPVSVIENLFSHGAAPMIAAVVSCVSWGSDEAARLIARTYEARHTDFRAAFETARRGEIEKLSATLAKVNAGKLHHPLGRDGLERHIAALKGFDPSSRGS